MESEPDVSHVSEEKPAGKRKGPRKGFIVVGVVATVLVVAGVGGFIWHNQPSFCSTICHDTMGPYMATWEGEGDYLVKAHADQGVACLDCHEATIEEQLTELQAQLTGDYKQPLAKLKVDDSFCLREGCHVRSEVEAKTEGYVASDGTAFNPHTKTVASNYGADESPHEVDGESIPCATCHTSHRESPGLEYCYSCHHTEKFDACTSCHDHR